MKNKKLFIVLGVILGIIIALIATYFILLTPSSKSNKVITFTVKKGDGKEKIVDNLKDAKLIRSKYAAIIYLVISVIRTCKLELMNLVEICQLKILLNL